ncbi:MAG: hypothetical protein IRY94_00190 [Rhodospirillaceae bacterium]|nr:hypothetical protein [Rhodospirillaceae bacterium]
MSTAGATTIFYNPVDAGSGKYNNPADYSAHVGGGTLLANMLVNDVDDLQAIDTNLAGHYALGRDIDAAATVARNGGAGFVPIGSFASLFTGSLDGQGHTIDGLFIRGGGDVGLLGVIDTGGVVHALHLTGFDVRGHQNVAGLAGRSAGTIDDVTVAGIASIDATGSGVGSTVGLNSGSVTNATASGQVLWDGHAVEAVVGSQRGLVGAGSGTVASSSFTGDVYEVPVPQTGFVLDPNLIRFLMPGQGDLGAPGASGDALADGTGGAGAYQTDILGAGYGLGGLGSIGQEGLNPAAGGGGGYDGSLCVEQILQNMWAQNQCL